MLNIFPDLITFVLFAPTLLRIVAGSFFLLWGLRLFKADRYAECASALRVKWGATGILFIWYLGFLELAVGGMLITGFFTQIAAIGGMLIAGKLYYLRGQFNEIAHMPKSTSILIFVICLSLLLTGAGAFGFDFPRL